VLANGVGNGIGKTASATAGPLPSPSGKRGSRVIAVDRVTQTAAEPGSLALDRGVTGAWTKTADVSDEHATDKLAERVTDSHGVVDVRRVPDRARPATPAHVSSSPCD
jgi:hypothetical protein